MLRRITVLTHDYFYAAKANTIARRAMILIRRSLIQNFNPIASNYTILPRCRVSHPLCLYGIVSHFSTKTLNQKQTSARHGNYFNSNSETLQPKSRKLDEQNVRHGVTQNLADAEQKKPEKVGTAKYVKPKQQPLGPPFSLFVTCLPGLEPFLREEIEFLRNKWEGNNGNTTTNQSLQIPRVIAGGVKMTIPTLAHLYTLRLFLGTASHIYIRLNDNPEIGCNSSSCAQIPTLFRARGFPELERKLKDLIIAQEWNRWLCLNTLPGSKHGSKVPRWNLKVHVTTSKSKLIHSKAIEERVVKWVGEALGLDLGNDTPEKMPDQQKPTLRILVRIERDTVQLSLDTTASPMHLRGYRINPHKAPLREDLAFALLMAGGLKTDWNLESLLSLLGWPQSSTVEQDKSVHLFDPCCGSGTIAIEGYGILANLPPGRNASAPLQGTLFCDEKLWNGMKKTMLAAARSRKKVHVTANDIEQGAIDAAKLNAKKAGVLDFIDFTTCRFQDHSVFRSKQESNEASQLIVTNPPYGRRLSNSPATYNKLAKTISSMSAKDVSYAMIGTDPRQLRETGLPMEVKFSSKSGGLNVVAMAGEIKR